MAIYWLWSNKKEAALLIIGSLIVAGNVLTMFGVASLIRQVKTNRDNTAEVTHAFELYSDTARQANPNLPLPAVEVATPADNPHKIEPRVVLRPPLIPPTPATTPEATAQPPVPTPKIVTRTKRIYASPAPFRWPREPKQTKR